MPTGEPNNKINFEKDMMLVVTLDEWGNVETNAVNMGNVDFKTAIGILQVAILKLASLDISGSATLRQQELTNGIITANPYEVQQINKTKA